MTSILQTVILTVASLGDPTKTAQAAITLTGGGSATSLPKIQLPVEVLGPRGIIASVPFTIAAGAKVSGPLQLAMQIHGLRYEGQASVQVNNSGWTAINSSTVTLAGNAGVYGGIGGGFSTLKMTMQLAAGAIRQGSNIIRFRFNGTDGRVSGFRVLAFNIEAADGSLLLPSSSFMEDDPNTWQPPSSTASDIAAGETLWHQAALTTPGSNGAQAIQAHCGDCHAQDGRDLKYFNYSNHSIRARAVFHGLTGQQGGQIASYIRSLNVENPGRPWNPPYQPGPGLDSKPVIDWAAGAGLEAVLDDDHGMFNSLFPSGIQAAVFSPDGNLNIRETGVPFQLPDWNQWLPGTHPKDAFGADFVNSGYNTIYQTLRAHLNVSDPAAYTGQKPNFGSWSDAYYGLYVKEGNPIWNNPTSWTPRTVDSMYSLAQWGMVKTWEMMNEFQLEGFGQYVFGSTQADQRAWYSQHPFMTSPHMLKMPTAGVAGLRNGTRAAYVYSAYMWYHLQLILNNSNKQQHDHQPIDWGYSLGFVKDMGSLGAADSNLQMMWLIKALQISNNGTGPEAGTNGWQPTVNDIGLLVVPEANAYEWPGVAPSTRAALDTEMVRAWLSQVRQFTPQQFYQGGWASATVNPVQGGNGYGSFADWVWYMIPRFRFLGVDATLLGQVAQWAQTVWPKANWTADLNATCSQPSNAIECSQ